MTGFPSLGGRVGQKAVVIEEALMPMAMADGVELRAFDSSGTIGYFEAFEANTTIAGQYAYSNYQYNGSNPAQGDLVANALNIFFVDTTEGLAMYGVLNNGVNNGGGVNNSFGAKVTYSQIETMHIEDDNESPTWAVGDSNSVFMMDFAWNKNYTDGWASTFTTSVPTGSTSRRRARFYPAWS